MRPIDWFAPVGLCVAGAGLCIWGAIVSSGAGRGVCLATAGGLVAILIAFVWMRLSARKPDFTIAVYEVHVVRGKRNRPTPQDVDRWVKRVVAHWAGQKIWPDLANGVTGEQITRVIRGTTLFYLDKEKLTVWGRAVRGFTQGKDCAIGYTVGAVESLTMHELSHVVLGGCGIAWSEQAHHDLFERTKLGA